MVKVLPLPSWQRAAFFETRQRIRPSKQATTSNLTMRICGICLGFALFGLWRSNELTVGQPFTIPEEGECSRRSRAGGKKCPCRIAITNSVTYHYEILESIASQLPLRFFNLEDADCDTTNLVFDFFIVQYRPPPRFWEYYRLDMVYRMLVPNQLAVSFVSYFESEMKGTTFVDEATSPNVTRTIGTLTVQRKNHDLKPIEVKGYDAMIEASCPCSSYNLLSLQHDRIRSCIFHETCPSVENHPRAVWVSPYHANFFIPTQLPKVAAAKARTAGAPLGLCVIGTVYRRSWRLLAAYLDQFTRNTHKSSPLSLSVEIMGVGRFPDELLPYKNMIRLSAPPGYLGFHQQVENDCDAILLLLTKQDQPQYFEGPESLLRLTGAIPLVMAYQKPILLHEELYRHYKKFFPSDLLAITHKDDTSSFVKAASDLIEKLSSSNMVQRNQGLQRADIEQRR
ncbi:hypothetical protein FisN_20Lh165 [Fistulifera solaris]|uniref:Uncharacterized protein n=1 Tax=Fistulifera solaris TaxID=1519565 RepID=A0A1Z5KRB0_FISSO|nr:hypothetical protein FisN_20Lh165 [Fistulifera solaris]|eukprot:GAX28864.1 hypothetical protein FisN_20Lh165 [Fistulifera solaris]